MPQQSQQCPPQLISPAAPIPLHPFTSWVKPLQPATPVKTSLKHLHNHALLLSTVKSPSIFSQA